MAKMIFRHPDEPTIKKAVNTTQYKWKKRFIWMSIVAGIELIFILATHLK